MKLSGAAKWGLLALAGLAIAIGVAIAAANLTSQQIGIASESVSAGDALAPALSVPGEGRAHRPSRDHNPNEEPTTTTPSEPPESTGEEPAPPPEEAEPPSEPGDDHGGHGSDGDD